MLAAVTNLSCEQLRNLCIRCNWTPPFSLTSIRYIVNVAKCREKNVTNTAKATFKYCPSQYGQYNISVAANNSVGVGNVTYKIVHLLKCKTMLTM